MKLGKQARQALVQASKEKSLYIEGNLLKIIEDEDDLDFKEYIRVAVDRDREARKKRLDITKQIQSTNVTLTESEKHNVKLMGELREALSVAQNAKEAVEQNLSTLQKKTQFELMGSIVKTALGVITGVGIVTTFIYAIALWTSKDVDHIGTVWASLIGILLTNSFSIIGTVMGVKYASENKSKPE